MPFHYLYICLLLWWNQEKSGGRERTCTWKSSSNIYIEDPMSAFMPKLTYSYSHTYFFGWIFFLGVVVSSRLPIGYGYGSSVFKYTPKHFFRRKIKNESKSKNTSKKNFRARASKSKWKCKFKAVIISSSSSSNIVHNINQCAVIENALSSLNKSLQHVHNTLLNFFF